MTRDYTTKRCRVGSAWPHGDGKGLNIQIASGVAVSGRLVLREYTEKDAEEDDKKAAAAKKPMRR